MALADVSGCGSIRRGHAHEGFKMIGLPATRAGPSLNVADGRVSRCTHDGEVYHGPRERGTGDVSRARATRAVGSRQLTVPGNYPGAHACSSSASRGQTADSMGGSLTNWYVSCHHATSLRVFNDVFGERKLRHALQYTDTLGDLTLGARELHAYQSEARVAFIPPVWQFPTGLPCSSVSILAKPAAWLASASANCTTLSWRPCSGVRAHAAAARLAAATASWTVSRVLTGTGGSGSRVAGLMPWRVRVVETSLPSMTFAKVSKVTKLMLCHVCVERNRLVSYVVVSK